MSLKKFLKNHISEILMGTVALMAGVLSFFITLSVYSQNVEPQNNEINLTNEIAKTTGSVKVYIDDEPVTNYDTGDDTVHDVVEEKEYKSLEERQINKNVNVDERLNWIDNDEEDILIETESDEIEFERVSETENIKEIKKVFNFKYPVSGDIILDYAKDKLVYSETLQEWITHEGVDIKAEVATPVKASEDGVVESIKMDPRYGNTIIISHENGYKTVYSNLSTLDMVYVGKNIKMGDIISGVGEGFGFESKEGPHVHFEVLDNRGETINFVKTFQQED